MSVREDGQYGALHRSQSARDRSLQPGRQEVHGGRLLGRVPTGRQWDQDCLRDAWDSLEIPSDPSKYLQCASNIQSKITIFKILNVPITIDGGREGPRVRLLRDLRWPRGPRGRTLRQGAPHGRNHKEQGNKRLRTPLGSGFPPKFQPILFRQFNADFGFENDKICIRTSLRASGAKTTTRLCCAPSARASFPCSR